MQTIPPPSIQGRFLSAAMLLVLGHPAIAGAQEPARELNVPPEGFTALFNGKDLTGWHTPPRVKEYWSIEDGVLKSPGTLWIVSRQNGTRQAECQLPAPPVLDGMALADSGMFVSMIDGSVACLRTNDQQ